MAAGFMWAAAVLAVGLAIELGFRYRRTRAPFYFWWTGSFLLYGMTFIAEALSVSHNYTVGEYVLYIIGSAGLVGFMSVGTSFLGFPRRFARVYAVLMSLALVGLVVSVGLHPPVLGHYSWILLNQGKAITGVAQALYIPIAAVGGTLVFVGAVWSWWRTRRGYNLLIAVGVLVSSGAGTLASQGAAGAAFPLTNIVALVLIYLGYRYSRASSAGRTTAASQTHQG
ncbi:MAG: hypothetical protein OWQ57_02395 [Sulfobacillus sp.]|nr:hypothetical protein [Sulfobacillus sp.]